MTTHAIVADSVITASGVSGGAVVVDGGRVVEVTNPDELGDLPRIVYSGATILPGLIDSHFHPVGYASLVAGVSVHAASGIDDLVEILTEATSSDGRGFVAQRFDDTLLGRMPDRRDLDRACPDRPLLVFRVCGHVAVANSAALALAGVGADTPDPPGGSLDRDGGGSPTGVLRETAIDLVAPTLDPLVDPPDDEAVVAALAGLPALGLTRLTAIVACDETPGCETGDELETLCRLAPDLPLDMDVLVIAPDAPRLAAAARRIDAADGPIRFWGWKDFADGSFGGHTAAMWRPYADRNTTGTLRLRPDHALAMSRAALERGGVAAIHAIGDRAIDATLDVFDRVLTDGGETQSLRIEHASTPSPEAVRRMASSGIIASVQPSFLTSEHSWVPRRLGPDRNPYPFASMAAAGVKLVGGSDCPVEPPDPVPGVAAAAFRQGWNDGEALTLPQAVDLFSSAPAALAGLDQPLSPGSPADLVVVRGLAPGSEPTIEAVYRSGKPVTVASTSWPG